MSRTYATAMKHIRAALRDVGDPFDLIEATMRTLDETAERLTELEDPDEYFLTIQTIQSLTARLRAAAEKEEDVLIAKGISRSRLKTRSRR